MFLEMSEFYLTIYVQMWCCLGFREGFMPIQTPDVPLLMDYDNRAVVLGRWKPSSILVSSLVQ